MRTTHGRTYYSEGELRAIHEHQARLAAYLQRCRKAAPQGTTVGRDASGCFVVLGFPDNRACSPLGEQWDIPNWVAARAATEAGWEIPSWMAGDSSPFRGFITREEYERVMGLEYRAIRGRPEVPAISRAGDPTVQELTSAYRAEVKSKIPAITLPAWRPAAFQEPLLPPVILRELNSVRLRGEEEPTA